MMSGGKTDGGDDLDAELDDELDEDELDDDELDDDELDDDDLDEDLIDLDDEYDEALDGIEKPHPGHRYDE